MYQKKEKEGQIMRLKYERERRCWTQEDVAEKIGTISVIISRWERGINYPSPYYRQKLCELFALSHDVLFSYQPAEPEQQNGGEGEAMFSSTFLFNAPLTNPCE